MLTVRDITKWFGDVRVLDRINFTLNRGEAAGLIGPNGSGKTTLLRIITGQLAPDRGHVALSPGSARVGYLAQALEFFPDATVRDVLAAAEGEREAAEARLAHLAEAVAAAADSNLTAVMAEYDRALADFQALGGGARYADASAVLAGLGMADVSHERLVASLSGGQKRDSDWRACSCPSRICFCSMSRPITLTSSRSNGWRPISPVTRGLF